MRHQVAGYKLNRSKDERDNLRRVLIGQFFEHERIKTTKPKAMAIRPDIEKLITLAAKASKAEAADVKVNARRKAAAMINNPVMVKKLFDDIAPRFATRKGGYTRIMKLGPRVGDAAEIVMLELIES